MAVAATHLKPLFFSSPFVLQMPCQDSKPVKKEDVQDQEDDKSLTSMLKSRNNNPTNDDDDHLPIKACFKSRSRDVKVKKEEYGIAAADDDDNLPIKSASRSKPARVKKEENDSDDGDHEPIAKKNSAPKTDKKKMKRKLKEEEEKANVAAEQNHKKEKKVYVLPGQKRNPPDERDPLRIFYETLYKQLPKSEMAQFWMMESGLLPEGEAKKVYEKKQMSKQQKLSTPKKSTVVVERSTKSVTVKRKLSSPVSSNKTKTTNSKVALKVSKKLKNDDESCGDNSEDDFVVSHVRAKKQKV